MFIVLRNKVDGRFHVAPGVWTEELEQARAFPTSHDAFEYVRTLGLADVEVLHHTPVNPAWDFAVCCPELGSLRAPWTLLAGPGNPSRQLTASPG